MEQFIRYIQFRKELLENLLTEKTDIDKALRLELDWIESNIELDEISYSVWVRRNAELERERKRESLIPT